MRKIENRQSQPSREPHKPVTAEACTDDRVLQDDELDAATGGYLQYKLDRCTVKSWSI
jgi:hypothetical protein